MIEMSSEMDLWMPVGGWRGKSVVGGYTSGFIGRMVSGYFLPKKSSRCKATPWMDCVADLWLSGRGEYLIVMQVVGRWVFPLGQTGGRICRSAWPDFISTTLLT